MRMLKTLLTTNDVGYATSTQELFSKVSIAVKEGDRVGLLGKNGTGKTTLLKILSGAVEPDQGTVIQNGAVGYVPQISDIDQRHFTITDQLHEHGCTYERFYRTYKDIFSSPVPQESDSSQDMSGGEQTKLWISMIAALEPALLLLDEPTNHLDKKSVSELESWLKVFRGAVVFVSHNRDFLSRVAKTVWDLEAKNISIFGDRYDAFLRHKQHEAAARSRQYEVTQKELRSLKDGVRMRETKAARAAGVAHKNKSESSRNKSAENYFRDRSEKGVGKIKKKHDKHSAELESLLELVRPEKKRSINVPLESQVFGKRLLIETNGLDVFAGYTKLLSSIDIRIEYGDRISLSGDNGTGKTLLVKALLSEIGHPTKGISKIGTGVQVQLIDQKYEVVDPALTVFENLEQKMKVVDEECVYKQVGRFLFPEYYAHKKAKELSGGEMARLAFAMATISPIDLLLLDEPTNNLDMETVDIILETLTDFQGALLVVSHDDHFLDPLMIQRKYSIKNGILSNV